MADISISCSICGTMQNIAASCAGQTVRCPVCNSALKVPGALAPDAVPLDSVSVAPPAAATPAGPAPAASAATVVARPVAADSSPLRLTKDRTADGSGRKCPACDATMGVDDLVCTQCGYHTQTGRSMADVAARRDAFRRALAATGALLIVLAAGFGAFRLGWFERRAPAPDSPPEATNGVAVAATNAPTTPPPPPPEVVERARTELKALLDRQCPQVREGDRINIELTTSRIVRGILRPGPERGTIAIETATNRTETLRLQMLKRGSRLQCDPDFRAQELERQVQKRLSL